MTRNRKCPLIRTVASIIRVYMTLPLSNSSNHKLKSMVLVRLHLLLRRGQWSERVLLKKLSSHQHQRQLQTTQPTRTPGTLQIIIFLHRRSSSNMQECIKWWDSCPHHHRLECTTRHTFHPRRAKMVPHRTDGYCNHSRRPRSSTRIQSMRQLINRRTSTTVQLPSATTLRCSTLRRRFRLKYNSNSSSWNNRSSIRCKLLISSRVFSTRHHT
mmetsp:Transcript_10494/g.22191  ORF Transcript_10494/g.22191 Transcript_10494/m.22191 type:complete len:213 (+) Transcript_10494:606-1244(+)